MTKKQKKFYLDHCGNLCPYCESGNVNGDGFVETDSGCAWQKVDCLDCGKSWRDLYTLTGVEEVNG